MVAERQTTRRRARWRVLALLAVVVTSATAWQGTGANAQPEQDGASERDVAPSEEVAGTATGSYRPGLTRAGLVSVPELGDAHLWVGLTSGFDRNTRFDIQVELLQDGTPVATGLTRCVDDLSAGRRHATEVVVPWDDHTPPTLGVGDVLSLRVSARMGTNEDGTRCGAGRGRHNAPRSSFGLRVYSGTAAHPSGFAATITPDPSVDLYLASGRTGCHVWPGWGRDGDDLSLSEEAPTGRRTTCRDSGWLSAWGGNDWSEAGTWKLPPQCDCANELIPAVRDNPPVPEPEEVVLERLPVPPVPVDGACDLAADPQGCVTNIDQVGGFIDVATIAANVTFSGAPGSAFDGRQVIAIRIDGSTFDNGTPWKCLTCGMPEANRNGLGANVSTSDLEPFNDGRRILAGQAILECAHDLASSACTPENTFLYPIRWNTSPTGEGPGGSMRELRMHPDDVHLGWSSLAIGTKLDQFMYYGRLEFNPAPTSGSPAVPRYDLTNVNVMYDGDRPGPVWPDPDDPGELRLDPLPQEVGEFRRWSKDGQWASYVGYPSQSNWIDMFAINLETGETRQLTRHPEYTDPMDFSYDGEWTVMLDTRTGGGGAEGADRQRFMSAIPGIPPLTDLISTGFVSSVRNEGQRRFFQPILLDIHGDRGDYEGQALKDSCLEGAQPGNLCDLDWAALSDPHFSPDGTSIVYREVNSGVGAPDEVTGRSSRIVIARLVEREPKAYTSPEPAPDVITWATPYTPGDPTPFRSTLLTPEGTYTLPGAVFGSAEVTIAHDTTSGPTPVVAEVAVSYDNFSMDGINVVNGTERVVRLPAPQSTTTAPALEWYSDLTLTGCQDGTKITFGPDGEEGGPFRARIDLFQTILFSEGDLVSTIDGVSYSKHPHGPNHRPF
jgi:hypothetical protein